MSVRLFRNTKGCPQYGFPRPPASVNSLGGIPKPSSSTETAPRPKSTLISILRASASKELKNNPSTTHESVEIVVEALICAATSGGMGRIVVELSCMWFLREIPKRYSAVGRVRLDQNDWALWHQTGFELKVVATSPANSSQKLVGALKTF